MGFGSIRRLFGTRTTEVQPIADNWIELQPGWLTDPVLKLQLWTTNGKEYNPRGVNLHLIYEPAIDLDCLLVPPSDKLKAIKRVDPRSTEREVNEPVTAWSNDGVTIQSMLLKWAEPSDDTLRIKVDKDQRGFELASSLFGKLAKPVAAAQPKRVLLYMIQSVAKFHAIGGDPIKDRVPRARRLEVCVLTEVARNFFGLSERSYVEVERGWVCVSGRNSV